MLESYQILNKELTLEVQKLRLDIKEYEQKQLRLQNEMRELQAQNAIMRSYLAQSFQHFSAYSNQFSSTYMELCARGIQINLPSSNHTSVVSNRRSSLRNSIPLCSPSRKSTSPTRLRSSPNITIPANPRLPFSGNKYREQLSNIRQNSMMPPENDNSGSYREDDERMNGEYHINFD
jgi:hypothetical protein